MTRASGGATAATGGGAKAPAAQPPVHARQEACLGCVHLSQGLSSCEATAATTFGVSNGAAIMGISASSHPSISVASGGAVGG